MTRDTNRLIVELDKYRRQINREMINPTTEAVEMETLLPVVKACARARADYIKCLMEIASDDNDKSCTQEDIEKLRQHRMAYDELVAAANALEIVIKREYIDVKEN
ncbi:MAG: hypothetical protein AB8B63_22520 [Granulosicoccus sp.]